MSGIAKKLMSAAAQKSASIEDLFDVQLYTGTGATQNITTNLDMVNQDGLVWMKNRGVVTAHSLTDTIRGARNVLASSSTGPQQLNSDVGVNTFLADGFSVTGNTGPSNASGSQYVSWNFIKQEKFFDITTYTGNGSTVGRTISHSLNNEVGMILVKRFNSSGNWFVFHRSAGATRSGLLPENSGGLNPFSTDPQAASSNIWDKTTPTDTTFKINGNTTINANTGTYVAYLFAHDPSPSGFIQCGQYTGNGSTSGPNVTLGWKPQFLMVKNLNTGGNPYLVYDYARPWSGGNLNLRWGGFQVENTDPALDFTPTGFQPRSTFSAVNANNNTYIYMAIREP